MTARSFFYWYVTPLLLGCKTVHSHVMTRNGNLESLLGGTHLGLLGIELPQVLYIIGYGIE